MKKVNRQTRLPTLKRAKKEAWQAFSNYIRERDNWTCFTCGQKGSGSGIHAGHFIPKKIGGVLLRFNPVNTHAQCYRCNRHLDGYGAMYARKLRHQSPGLEEALFDLMDASRMFKANLQWYIRTKNFYEGLLAGLNQTRQKPSNEV